MVINEEYKMHCGNVAYQISKLLFFSVPIIVAFLRMNLDVKNGFKTFIDKTGLLKSKPEYVLTTSWRVPLIGLGNQLGCGTMLYPPGLKNFQVISKRYFIIAC